MTVRFTDTVRDSDGNGIPGAFITVRNYPSGSLASITNDSGATITNSVITADGNGTYAFNAPAGFYTLEFRLLIYETARKVSLVDLNDITAQIFTAGPALPTIGSIAAIAWKREPDTPTYPVSSLAGFWSDKVWWNHAFGAEFDATTAPVNTPRKGPAATMMVAAQNKGTNATVCALQTICGVHANSEQASGVNFITYSDSGVTNAELIGLEIDINPAASGSVASGLALAINAFTKEIPGNAIYIEGLSGGNFSSGIRVGALNAASGAGLYGTGAMGCLIDSATGTYGQDAICLANTHKIRFRGTSTTHGKMYMANNDNLRIVLGGGALMMRDNTDTTSLFTVTANGIGYPTGVGGSVTQLTSKSTGVTLNKVCGQITLNNAALAANTIVSFTLTNSAIAADDDVRVWVKSGNASVGSYRVAAEGNGSGSRSIVVENKTAGSLSEAIVLGFNVLKAVAA